MASLDSMKQQLMTLMMVKNDNDPINMLYSFLVLMLMDPVLSFVIDMTNILKRLIKDQIDTFMKNKRRAFENIITTNTTDKVKTSSIMVERNYKVILPNVDIDLIDSVIETLSTHNNAKYVKYRTYYFINHNNELEIK